MLCVANLLAILSPNTCGQFHNGGRLEFEGKSAAVTPGIITSVYLHSNEATRTGDDQPGTQDQISFEFLGNNPTQVSDS